MIKNILGKGKENENISNDELKELKEKFKEITQENSVASDNNSPVANPTQTAAPTQPIAAAGQAPQQEVFVDPERVEENERITNLIMQQIKELIEIDNNLNIKIKEMETKIRTNISNVSDLKNVVDKFHNRLEFIEKNIEKFMGLYEVVTNRFNPFIENQEAGEKKEESNVAIPEIPKEETVATPVTATQIEETPVSPAVSEPVPTEKIEEVTPATPAASETTATSTEATKDESATIPDTPSEDENPSATETSQAMPESDTVKAAIQNVNIEDVPENQPEEEKDATPTEPSEITSLILKNAGIEGKIYGEDLDIVVNDIKAMIIKLGNKINGNLINEISDNLKKLINQLVVESIKSHTEINAEQVKATIAKIRTQFLGDSSADTELSKAPAEKPTAEAKPTEATPSASETQAEAVNTEGATTTTETAPASEEVPSDYHFTTADGQEVKSVAGLIDVLKNMDDKTFNEHVNDTKNDFAMWVGLVNDNWELGEKMTSIKTKDEILAELEKIK